MIDSHTFRLDGRIALVTGSSTGIGLAMARALAQAGATLVLNGRDKAKLASAAAQLESEGFVVHARAFDVTQRSEVDAHVAAVEGEVGPIEVLINNAGMQRRAPFQDYAIADWDALMRTNVDSVFHVGQAVARYMLPRRRGRIINICSVMSEFARPGISAYTATKGAVKNLTKGMAIDLAPHGINVNGIGPGYFKTDINEALMADANFNTWLIGRTPAKRWGDLEDLSGAAVFLASDASRFVNGHILYVDGGLIASI
jgi:gluconate 5-dehydrogenase